jgi:hypothetical protein
MEDTDFVLDISKSDLAMNGKINRLNKDNYDIIKKYDFNGTKLQIIKRCIDNGDFFLFFDITNPKPQKIIFKINNNPKVYSYEDIYEKPPYDDRYGENEVTGPYAYLDFNKNSAILSKLYYFNELRHNYPEDQYSSVLELKEENMDIEINNSRIIMNISNISDNCSFFILLSKEQLFTNKQNSDNFFKKYFESIKSNAVESSYFIRYDGTYTKLPYSIEPFTIHGYGFSLHHSSKRELIPELKKKKDRYFYDFIVNAITQTVLYQKNENGVFFTKHTSTWLKKDTGITAPYIDTRLNETFNLMVTNFKKIYPEFDIKNYTQNYCDFLIKEFELDNVYRLNEGIFFPDYFKNNMVEKTHSSLNHQLGIINLMFHIYRKTKKEKYLKLAKKMLIFLEKTHYLWINPENNNLFYGIKVQDKNIEMFGNDYVYVTLIDLLSIQKALDDNHLVKNPIIDELIFSKIEYLNNNGFSISDVNAKLAPGELYNRKVALKLYANEYY